MGKFLTSIVLFFVLASSALLSIIVCENVTLSWFLGAGAGIFCASYALTR